MDAQHIPARTRMAAGQYIATADIPLNPPFRASIMPRGTKFEILGTTDGLSLVKHEGIRVWKATYTLQGRATCVLRKVETPSTTASPQVTQQQATSNLHPVFQDIVGAMKAAYPALQ